MTGVDQPGKASTLGAFGKAGGSGGRFAEQLVAGEMADGKAAVEGNRDDRRMARKTAKKRSKRISNRNP